MFRTILGVAAAILVAPLVSSAPAIAADPPSSWTQLRIITCDGETLRTYLSPAGFGTAFHVVGSRQAIIPVHVEVMAPGSNRPVVTLDRPGLGSSRDAVRCWYTDPTGLVVDFRGLRT